MENTFEKEENTFYMDKDISFINKNTFLPRMEIRTIVKSGKASFTVAIPKHWIEKNKLKKGDKIYIEEKTDNELMLSTHHQSSPIEKKDFVINVDNKDYHVINRELISAYLNPHRLIILKGKDLPKHIEGLKREISGLFALEVIDESSTKLVADSFLDIKTVSVEKLTRRIDNITRSMMIDTVAMIKGDDTHEIIINRDYDVNRIGFLILKILKASFADPSIKQAIALDNLEALGYWELQIRIEKIADNIKRIARNLSVVKKKKNADLAGLQKILERTYQEYCKTMALFYTKKPDCVIMVKRGELIDMCDDYFLRNKTVEVAQITHKIKAILSDTVDIHRLTRNLCLNQ